MFNCEERFFHVAPERKKGGVREVTGGSERARALVVFPLDG